MGAPPPSVPPIERVLDLAEAGWYEMTVVYNAGTDAADYSLRIAPGVRVCPSQPNTLP